MQCDEKWSFVGNKSNKQWVWLAIDADTKEIVGCYVGKRDKDGAEGLRKSLPPVYRQCAVCYTDFWSAYEEIFPSKRHRPVPKQSGKTSYIERLNETKGFTVGQKDTLFFKKNQKSYRSNMEFHTLL